MDKLLDQVQNRSEFNIRLKYLTKSGNAIKSNKIPIEFLIKDGEKYSGINYEKIEEYINEVRDNTYDKLNDLINRLTGN